MSGSCATIVGKTLLYVRHLLERDVLRGLGDTEHDAVVLRREEALGDYDVKIDAQTDGAEEHQQCDEVVTQGNVQGSPVARDQPVNMASIAR